MSNERPLWAKNLTDVQANRVIDALMQAAELRVSETPDGTHAILKFVVPHDASFEALHISDEIELPRERTPVFCEARVTTEARWERTETPKKPVYIGPAYGLPSEYRQT